MTRSKLLIFALTLLAILCIVLLYYRQSELLEGFEAETYDFRFTTLRGPLEPCRDLVIVAIDEPSIAAFGRFPWSRTRFAQLLDRAGEAGARAIFIDAFFPETESSEADAAFAAALARSGRTHLAVAFDFAPDGSVSGLTRSLPAFEQSARPAAHINLTPDRDGVVRWTPLLLPVDDRLVPSLALSAAQELLGGEIVPGAYSVGLGTRAIPTDGAHFALVNYTGPPGLYPRLSFADVAEGRVPAEQLRDKILLVGATALGIYDMRVTPFSNNSPGVEIHANLIDSIVNGRFIQRGGFEALFDLAAIILLGCLTAFITLSLRHAVSLPLVGLLIAAHLTLAHQLFLRGHWVSMVYPTLSIVLAFSLTAYLRFFFLDRQAREIRSIFSSYVSRSVVDRLVKDPRQARVGGENRVITVLFSDIGNYTGFSEKLPPEQVLRILNEYLASMTEIIMAADGTLDKFIGDGIMAFWGAPVEQASHAERAVECALRMIARMHELRESWTQEGHESLSIRIGINSGEVVVGNIGAEGKKMEYTAIGDNVNIAARLEGVNKLYGSQLIISEATRQLLPAGRFATRELDVVRVKGRETAMVICEVLPGFDGRLEPFAEALALFRQRRFDQARQLFERLAADYDDPPARLYARRCAELSANPPDGDWDGTTIFLRK